MSDENSNGDEALPNVNALLAELRAKRDEFHAFVDSSMVKIREDIANTEAALSEARTFKESSLGARSAVEADQNEISELLNRAKSTLVDIDADRTNIATMKGAIEAEQTAASEHLGIIVQSKAEVEEIKSSISTRAKGIIKQHNDISAKISALEEKQVSLQNVLDEVAAAKSAAEADASLARDSVTKIEETRAAFESLNDSGQQKYQELARSQEALQGKIEEIERAHGEISNLRQKLLESTEGTKSVQDEIHDLRAQIGTILESVSDEQAAAFNALATMKEKAEQSGKEFSSAQNEKFNKLYESLEDRILSLLPSAGAAGLASTYYDAKSRYSPTSYAGKPGTLALTGWTKILRSSVGNNPISVIATFFFYAMFIFPLLILTFGTYELVLKLETDQDFVFDYRILALRFLIAVPLATISAFGFASLRLYRKLYEEYNHKQRVMELYRSFSDEIDKHGDKEQVKALLKIMLSSVSSKAWESAEDGERQVDGQSMVSNLNQMANVVQRFKSILGNQ